MTAHPFPMADPEQAGAAAAEPAEAVLYAVLDDVRNTLGMAWLDPAFRSIASDPVFFTAAWSATRPNVTKSFTESAVRLRGIAAEAARKKLGPPDHRSGLGEHFSPEDQDRLIRTVRALHYGLPKVYLVIQAWARLARRQRIPGTGREEVPARRGVPAWQDGVIVSGSVPDELADMLDEVTGRLGVVTSPSSLLALVPAPAYLRRAVEDVLDTIASDEWGSSLVSLRRAATRGLESFPHPMDLQWDALAARGLAESRREALAERLRDLAALMPVNVMIAAYLSAALGIPEPAGDA